MDRAFGRETFDLCVDLLCNGKSGVCCKISASALLQKMQPFLPRVPSRLGQDMPPFNATR